MKQYLDHIIKAAETTKMLCENAISEINDGAERGHIILSLMEAVYDYQNIVTGYMNMYYDYFDKDYPNFDEKLTRRAERFLDYSPEEQMKRKHKRRIEMQRLP